MEIISLKNKKYSKCRDFRQICPKRTGKEMTLKEITEKIPKKLRGSNFRQNCPKWSAREMELKEITEKFQKNTKKIQKNKTCSETVTLVR